MEKLNLLKTALVSALVVVALTSCTSELPAKGAIIPHHLLVEEQMEELYTEIASEDIEKVILISPNHFNYGFNYIQTTDEDLENAEVEPKYFEEEHGISVHEDFISRHFPNAKIVPIIIKNDTPQNRIDDLLEELTAQNLDKTVVIASIDFTHYELEEIAVENDERTMQWLRDWSQHESEDSFNEIKNLAINVGESSPDAVAMDSPESFYMLTRIMEAQNAKDLTIVQRTSSASITGIKDPSQNTSHLFVKFR